MYEIIDDSTLLKYRVPGAHTGLLPYSVACEARNYVRGYLPIIETWFK